MRHPCGHGRDDTAVECAVCQIESLTADRDALAALLKEARVFVPSHDDVAIRIDAASGR